MSTSETERATLLVSCPDRRGIVAALAQVLYGHGANILDSDQHTDAEAAQFFQRIHFDLTDLQSDRGTLERAIAGRTTFIGPTLPLISCLIWSEVGASNSST